MLLEPSVAVGWGSAPAARHDSLAMLADPAFNLFYDAGTLIVVCRRMAGAFADADCWLAVENLMLAATARGLGSCCIGRCADHRRLCEGHKERNCTRRRSRTPLTIGVDPPQGSRWRGK
jgi:hypothetical protein